MNRENLRIPALLFALAMTLSACGGSSSPATQTGPTNTAPVANAGANASVDELASVTLDGSLSSDADGDTLTYAWTQTAGTSVTLTNATSVQATFDAPDVTAVNTPDSLTFQLQVSDGSLSNSATVTITVNDIGVGVNSPPVASAGPDQTVGELSNVDLDGTGSSDPDGDPVTYAWLQTAGPNVTLSNPTAAAPSFTSPDVTSPVVLTFQLTVDDGTDSAMDTVDITVQEALSAVTVAGIVSFEFALPNANCRGLNLDNPETRPIRGATVQFFDSSNALLGSTVSGPDGSYSFTNIDANQDVYVRVRAELKSSGPAAWDVEVRDNVDTSGSPPPLASRPLYVVDFPTFNTGAANIPDADFTATTGWNGSAYTGPRQAAPFAILDAIMDGMEMITAVDPTANFSPLDAFWSVNNTLTSPTDIDAGELGSSFYSGGIDSLFLLGDPGTDTEEFDDHVSMHEWGHYFEDNFSRSDSIGGAHTIGETLDPRLAFGEGFATALAAIALDNPQYCDTSAPMESGGFGLDTENENRGPQGYYNEMSVATLLYDLVDTNVDGTDVGSIGFGPIYNVMTGPQATTDAFTSLFSFATELRNEVQAADLAFVDSQLTRENVDLPGLNEYGDTQTIVPAGSRDVLPVYTVLPTDGTLINICANSDFDDDRDGNKLSEHRFLKFTTTSTSSYNVSVVANPVPPPTTDPTPTPPDVIRDRSDPDVFIYRGPQLVAIGNSGDDDAETFTTNPLPAGNYVMDLQEWRYSDDDASSDFPEQVCFDVTMGP
jgi:K319L-like, PKD domain